MPFPVFEDVMKEGMKKFNPTLFAEDEKLPVDDTDWDNLDFSPVEEQPKPKPISDNLDWDNIDFDPNIPTLLY